MIREIIFKLCKYCIRLFTHSYSLKGAYDSNEPAVYIVHHQNLRGPITCLIWFNIKVRIWVLNVFFDQNTCFRQYYDYTFTKRFGIPRVIAAIIAFPLSYFISGLMKLIEAIPVFRGKKDIIKTLRLSISALTSGQSLLICPDIDYTDTSSNMGEMYKGFLNLEKYYIKQTGKHIAFIPLHINKNKRYIYVGKAIYFNGFSNFNEEKLEISDQLKNEFMRLEKE